VVRTCKLCGEGFEVEYSRTGGRPREYCYDCVPAGFKAVRLPHRTKLRRVTPLGPRVPMGGGAKLYRIPLSSTGARVSEYRRVQTQPVGAEIG
jgi:hypothetical protein